MILTFAWRYFIARKSTNAINIIAWVTLSVIAFATCCQVLVLSVFNGFEGLVKSLYSSFYTDIKITPARGKTFLLDAAQIKALRQDSVVDNMSMIAEDKALLKNHDAQTVIYLKGVEDNYPRVSGVAERTTQGIFSTGTVEAPLLVAGAGIQNAVGINVDPALPNGELTVILPKRSAPGNDPLQLMSEGNLRASGIFTIQQDFDNKYAITNIGFVKQQMGFGNDEYSAIELKLKQKVNAETAKKRLAKLFGANYRIETKYEQNSSLYDTMKMEKWAIYAVLTFILLIAAFNMVSALTMLVLEKRKDISILQSLGTNRKSLLKIFLAEGFLLGGIGAVSGIILAVLICFLQVKFKLIKITGGSFLIDYFPVKLVATDFLLVGATSAVIAIIASWFPARKAAGQNIDLR